MNQMARFDSLIAAVLVLPVATVVGCAHGSTPGTRSGAEEFALWGSGFETTAQVNGDGAQGPQVDVGRYDDGATFRGTAFGRPVDVSVTADTVRGEWGSTPLNLEVTSRTPHDFQVTGEVAGVPSTFSFDPERIQGTIGRCAYDLSWSGKSYVGTRSCRGGIQSVTMSLPASVSQWSSADTALLMALLMPEV